MRFKLFGALTALIFTANVSAALVAVDTYLVAPGDAPTIKYSVDFSEAPTNSWKYSGEKSFELIFLDDQLHQIGRDWIPNSYMLTTDSPYKDEFSLSWYDWSSLPNLMAIKVNPLFGPLSVYRLDTCAFRDFTCTPMFKTPLQAQSGYIFLHGDPSIVSEPSGWLAAIGLIALAARRRVAMFNRFMRQGK